MAAKRVSLGPWPYGVDSKTPARRVGDKAMARAENVYFDQDGRVLSLASNGPPFYGPPVRSARYSFQLRRLVATTRSDVGFLSSRLEYTPVWPIPNVADWESGQEYLLAANRQLHVLPLDDKQSTRALPIAGNACALVGGTAVGAMLGSNLVEYSGAFEDGSPTAKHLNREVDVYRYRLVSGRVTALAGVGYSLFIGTDLGLLQVHGLGTQDETERYVTRRPVSEYGVVAIPGTEVGRGFSVSTNVAVWFDSDGIGIATEQGEIIRPVAGRFYNPSPPRRVSITASNGIILVSEIR